MHTWQTGAACTQPWNPTGKSLLAAPRGATATLTGTVWCLCHFLDAHNAIGSVWVASCILLYLQSRELLLLCLVSAMISTSNLWLLLVHTAPRFSCISLHTYSNSCQQHEITLINLIHVIAFLHSLAVKFYHRLKCSSPFFLISLPHVFVFVFSFFANDWTQCSEASMVTIEGPLRRKTLLKEGRKPKVETPGT